MRHQAIIWAKVDPHLCCYIASLSHKNCRINPTLFKTINTWTAVRFWETLGAILKYFICSTHFIFSKSLIKINFAEHVCNFCSHHCASCWPGICCHSDDQVWVPPIYRGLLYEVSIAKETSEITSIYSSFATMLMEELGHLQAWRWSC